MTPGRSACLRTTTDKAGRRASSEPVMAVPSEVDPLVDRQVLVGSFLAEMIQLAQESHGEKLTAESKASPALAARLSEVADRLDEAFFQHGQAYLQMAAGEGNEAMANALAVVLRAAMEQKQQSLPPEYRLLNNLMRAVPGADPNQVAWEVQDPLELLANAEQRADVEGREGLFMRALNQLLQDVQSAGGPTSWPAAQRLERVRTDAVASGFPTV